MKNSRKSQIPVLIILAISLVISFLFVLRTPRVIEFEQFWYRRGLPHFLEYGLFVIAICAIIYYIVFSEKKKISIAVSIAAIVIDMLITFLYYYVNTIIRIPKGLFWEYFWYVNQHIPNHVRYGGIFFALLIIFVALIVGFKKSPKQREQKYNYMKTDTIVSSESKREERSMIKIIQEMFDETSNKCLKIYKGYTMITFWLLIVVAVICSIQGFTDNMWIVDEEPLIDGLLFLIVGIFAACAHLVINMLIFQFLNNVQIIREKIEETSQKEKE